MVRRRDAGQTANPSGLLEGAVMMLNHIGQTVIAEKYKTLG
jgi:isocitrate dehydrogenase